MQIRSQRIIPNLQLNYGKDPIKIVKGRGQYLFDEKGNKYTDCINNVCTVGHCHPLVVKAIQDQVAELNTNSRFLHDNMVQCAIELGQTLPEPLRVCVFVNSGSEANELAIRMARAYTRQKDMLILDSAYHGNTNLLVELSPYKYEGPGGFIPPNTTNKIMLPDTYRGPYKADNPNAGPLYALDVKHKIEIIQAQGRNVCAFLAESIQSCGGQIIYPPNYLRDVYKYVRAAGGVCIADEVQTGYARVGKHFWAFELQDVVPDIVVVGKPMANGYPMSAVITTPKVAAAFSNGMDYFNTFGGNPVGCAAALAVLRAIKEDGLQENSHVVGDYVLSKLKALQSRHPLMGDVRGIGLMIGIELVRDRQTLEPATAEAKECILLCRKNFVLLSVDGPLNNVIKIKPPTCFTIADADTMLHEFDRALTSIESRMQAHL